jgi:hypothetical protein
MSHEDSVQKGVFTASDEMSEWMEFRGKFNFCLANTDEESPTEFSSPVEILLVAKFDGDTQEYLMNGPEGVVFTAPGVHVVDIPESRMEFQVRAKTVPNGVEVAYRISR